jgi:hypothetical protein
MYVWWSSVDNTVMKSNNNDQLVEAPDSGSTSPTDNDASPIADADVATILFVNTPEESDASELASAEQEMSALRFLSEQAHENGAQ